MQNVTPYDSKPLVGYEPFWRVDIGEYRIVYRFDDDSVYVALVGKRNDDEVYRELRNLLRR
ncbi:MAG: type II toxin-antitoxin system RelE/ParE family toxin [Deltaproteobacteria bacterium]|nr:type II toxin-antitoxin system RelE/ParE family toxin [Deltaproteobacteria bacterium]